ncbi:TPA: hypothetical protein RQ678_003311 [Klebsiella pneumoniae]|nr:hypothetical protein [Klebsiella pneumoniae]
MKTDITELAQREKFEAWVMTQICISKSALEGLRTSDGYRNSTLSGSDYNLMWNLWKAAGAELVEALEKAQQVDEELCKLLPPGAEYMDPPDGGDITPLEGVCRMVAYYRQRIAELESRTVTAAAADVLAERKRQVTTEGWTPEHDDQHVNFEMAIAGGLYAISAVDSHHKLRNSAPSAWPWDRKWWKPDGPRRDLVKAGALILAEIERLDRAAGIKVEAE